MKKTEIIERLRNAGFQKADIEGTYHKSSQHFTVYLEPSLPFNPKVISHCNGTIPSRQGIESFEQLNKCLYAFLYEDLDFEGKWKYTWQSCLVNSGFYIDGSSTIKDHTIVKGEDISCSKNVVPTKQDAESMLAYAQLSNIVAKLNKDFTAGKKYSFTIYYDKNCNRFHTVESDLGEHEGPIFVYSEVSAEILIKQHSDLLLKYLKLK